MTTPIVHIPARRRPPAVVKIQQAVRQLIANHPFFGTLCFHLLPYVEDDSIPTIGADGVNLRYNTEWIMECTHEDLRFAIARCALSCGLLHHTRRGDRTAGRWNRASRAVTLPIMEEMGYQHDETGSMSGVSIEKAYEMLPPDEDNDGGDNASGGGQGQGQGQGGGQGQGQGQGSGQGQGPPLGNQLGITMDHPNGAQSDGQQGSENDWTHNVQQSAQVAKQMGTGADLIEQMIHESFRGSVDWEAQLKEWLTQHDPNERSWNLPDRRFAGSNDGDYEFMPGMSGTKMGDIVLAVDVSWSLTDHELNKLWAEVRTLASQLEPEMVRIIQCHVHVSSDEAYDPWSAPRDLHITERGGTDFRPVFDRVAKSGHEPSCLVYLTDLECSLYAERVPMYPVLWVSTVPITDRNRPPFGETLELSL